MLSEAGAWRLAKLLTEQQKQDITLLAWVLRTDLRLEKKQRPKEDRIK